MGSHYKFKLVLFGNPAVGKTSIIDRYVNNKFEQEYLSTLGYNVFEKTIEINEDSVSFMIFDIGGQETFQNLRKVYAAEAKVALLVYDITDRFSFDNIKNWHKDLMDFTEKASFILIGNKVDLQNERRVQRQEGEVLAKELGAGGFFETSAKNNEGIDDAFQTLARKILYRIAYLEV